MSEVAKEIKSELHRRVVENLKARRKLLKLTQSQLAEKVGMNQSSYAQIELGYFAPGLELIERIAHALGADPGTLFVETRSPARSA